MRVLRRQGTRLHRRYDRRLASSASGAPAEGLTRLRLSRRPTSLLQLLHVQEDHQAHQRRQPQQRKQGPPAVHPEPALPHHHGNHSSPPWRLLAQRLWSDPGLCCRMFSTPSATPSGTSCGSSSSSATESRQWWSILERCVLDACGMRVGCVLFLDPALCRFESVHCAQKAKAALNGADIYAGCCTLKIEYARVGGDASQLAHARGG